MNAPCETYLYRAFDADRRLLYVGITKWSDVRMDAHAKTSAWYELAADIQYFEYPSRDAAMAAEVAEIIKHCPPYNVAGNPALTKPAGSMTVSYKVTPARWTHMTMHKNAERTSLQAVIDDALGKYFEARGLPF